MELWNFAKELMNVPLGLAVLFLAGIGCGFILSRKRLERKIATLEKRIEELERFKADYEAAQEAFRRIGIQTDGKRIYIPSGDHVCCIPDDGLIVGLSKLAKALNVEVPIYSPTAGE